MMDNRPKPITDNMQWTSLCDVGLKASESDLEKIANFSIAELKKENPNLLVFPRDLGEHGDDIGEGCIVRMRGSDENTEISTGNVMGFVGIGSMQISIRSRFSKDGVEDYFLHYMLQRVFRINLFDMQHGTSLDSAFDFRLYLFPYLLQKAMQQGLYKKYRRIERNDANVKGTINVARHIKQNIPFRGTIAYTEREHSTDNPVMQLIRHTIEFIAGHAYASTILNNDNETKDCIMLVRNVTPSYNAQRRREVINQNLRPVVHPFYSEYTTLQTLCLQILRHEEIKFGNDDDKVYGVLFDGAWLWEEYLNKIFEENNFKITHAENKTGMTPIYLFKKKQDDNDVRKGYTPRYPDFYSLEKKLILDAKYKHLRNNEIDRDDIHQIISYMYVTQAEAGGLLYPDEAKTEKTEIGTLHGYGGKFFAQSLCIPQEAENMQDFVSKIKTEEKGFISLLNL